MRPLNQAVHPSNIVATMVQLMKLPDEIRLRIYEAVVTEDFEIAIHKSQKSPRLRDASNLRLIDKSLSDDIVPLYWSRNTFYYFDLFFFNDDDYLRRSWARWLSCSVKEAVRHIRRLEFYIDIPTKHRCEGSTSSGEADSKCLFTATVHLGTQTDSAVQVERDSCTYAELAYDRLMSVVSRIPHQNRQPQVSSALIMELLECTLSLKFTKADEGK